MQIIDGIASRPKRVRGAEYMERQRRHKAAVHARRRAMAMEALGGRCAHPGCVKTDRLHIDHIDPAAKAFAISSHAPTDEAFLRELEKCQLLCAEHHREKTGAERAGERHPLAKLTVGQVRQIRHRLAAGERGRALAREFGVGPMTISRIKTGKRWRSVA